MSSSPLTAILRAQVALFVELRELVIAQRQALLAADEPEALRLNARAETLATRFRLLEEQRRRCDPPSASTPADDALAGDAELATARREAAAGLAALLREAAVAGTVLERLGETLLTRRGLVDPLSAPSYRADGRARTAVASGNALAVEG